MFFFGGCVNDLHFITRWRPRDSAWHVTHQLLYSISSADKVLLQRGLVVFSFYFQYLWHCGRSFFGQKIILAIQTQVLWIKLKCGSFGLWVLSHRLKIRPTIFCLNTFVHNYYWMTQTFCSGAWRRFPAASRSTFPGRIAIRRICLPRRKTAPSSARTSVCWPSGPSGRPVSRWVAVGWFESRARLNC